MTMPLEHFITVEQAAQGVEGRVDPDSIRRWQTIGGGGPDPLEHVVSPTEIPAQTKPAGKDRRSPTTASRAARKR